MSAGLLQCPELSDRGFCTRISRPGSRLRLKTWLLRQTPRSAPNNSLVPHQAAPGSKDSYVQGDDWQAGERQPGSASPIVYAPVHIPIRIARATLLQCYRRAERTGWTGLPWTGPDQNCRLHLHRRLLPEIGWQASPKERLEFAEHRTAIRLHASFLALPPACAARLARN